MLHKGGLKVGIPAGTVRYMYYYSICVKLGKVLHCDVVPLVLYRPYNNTAFTSTKAYVLPHEKEDSGTIMDKSILLGYNLTYSFRIYIER